MATYGDALLDDYRRTEAALRALALGDYSSDQIRDEIIRIGTKTELFLKGLVFPQLNPRGRFESFIDALRSSGIGHQHVIALHDLRRLYNAAKHTPAQHLSLVKATRVIVGAGSALGSIVSNRIGAVAKIVNPECRRLFWVAAWDHFIHGDTEVHFFLPVDTDHWLGAPTMDLIYIDCRGWDAVKSELIMAGYATESGGLIPDKHLATFRAGDGFAGSFVFEGDYRTLLTAFAQHERRQTLIPGLNRFDHEFSMMLALLMATIDVAGTTGTLEEVSDAIRTQASTVYAVPENYAVLERICGSLARMLSDVDDSLRASLTGPVLVDPDRFAELEDHCLTRHPQIGALITEGAAVVVRRPE